MKKYLVVQNRIQKHINDLDVNIHVDCVIRRVKAKSKHEAIGLFLEQTSDNSLIESLPPLCYEIKNIREVEPRNKD